MSTWIGSFESCLRIRRQRRRTAHRAISTIVVNNNAAAVLLALNTLAEDGEVIVSRGELVEIGGSFRIPDVMSKSGATLREVGTTNRTRVADYENAINERTRALLRVHRSNFEITGFTERPALADLAKLARARNIPLLEDLGSGALVDLRNFGISGEPNVLDSLHAAVDVVTYSGDKLLGGPQAGLLSGRADLIARMRKNSLFRALRVDKLTYAALAATLLAYVKHDHAAIPALRMMRFTKQEIARARRGSGSEAALRRAEVEFRDRGWRIRHWRRGGAFLRAADAADRFDAARFHCGMAVSSPAPLRSSNRRPSRRWPRAAGSAHRVSRTGPHHRRCDSAHLIERESSSLWQRSTPSATPRALWTT